MDKTEAKDVLNRELEPYRARSYGQLVTLIGEPVVFEKAGRSGTQYQIEIEAFWDNQPNSDVHVMGSIDDGGWRAFIPLTVSFIMTPGGAFVGE